jgi:hypothetical protein
VIRADNFRLVAAGGLPDVIEQVRKWHDGVRVLEPAGAPPSSSEDEAWDALIHTAPDYPHRKGGNRWGTGGACECHACRPRRRYK